MVIGLEKSEEDEMIAERILAGEKVAFSRWGDGEWSCAFFEGLENCDRHQYFYDLAYALRGVLENKVSDNVDDYVFGMQDKAWDSMKFGITNYLEGKGIGKKWVDADEFHKMSERGELMTWIEAIKKPIGLVANEFVLTGAPERFKQVIIPPFNAWLGYDKKKFIDAFRSMEDGVIFVCAGMMGKVLIDDLYFSEIGNHHSLIDLGSALDPYYAKQCTRNYHVKVVGRETP